MRTLRGFTLFEILVVIGIVMIMAFVGISGYAPRTNKSRSEEVVSGLESFIYQCQQDAYGGKNGRACGVKFSSHYYEVYSGDSYAHAVTKETIDFSSGVSVSSVNFGSGTEVIFGPGSFRPLLSGTVTIGDGLNVFTITVTEEGLIYYQ